MDRKNVKMKVGEREKRSRKEEKKADGRIGR
jgi:hypothetical protein